MVRKKTRIRTAHAGLGWLMNSKLLMTSHSAYLFNDSHVVRDLTRILNVYSMNKHFTHFFFF